MRNSLSLREMIRRGGFSSDFRLFKVYFKSIGGSPKIQLLWKCYRVARDTDFFTEEVHLYLFNTLTYEEVSERTGYSRAKIKNNIYRQVRDYYDFIGGDFYAMIKNGELSDDESALLSQDMDRKIGMLGVRGNPIESYFYEDFFTGAGNWGDRKELSQEDFEQARDRFSKYSIRVGKMVLDNVDSEWRDYVVHLLLTGDEYLSELQLDRKRNLIRFMKLNDLYGIKI